ncbi:HhH-GPD-type base excision DNA repair protein [Agromyces atrinae]|uniref:Fe-S cluster assembly protein HesB n=1 Tax=Agromyces atrinae TaxID=592376 RepID=A0A4V1R1X5_9MICO|nr:HhH-GPD-type base excision DNA repair protein [Agromyces atrinae]NYD68432.1 putative HhH-GPD family protein [Agromyces atrinae]RXZ85176.1 Fe-S cluster assembly protein HesB [Agromyces atrinae]
MNPTLHITGDDAADALLSSNPLALLIGMLLDQQVPMETAFAGPAKISDRLGSFSAEAIASTDPTEFTAIFKESPAVHRFPGSMAERVQALCQALVDDWGGDAAAIWTSGDPDGAEILARLKALPGFGDQKATIFLALLGKQYGLTADGWREAAGRYGEEGSLRSVADIVDTDSLAKVREAKKAAKAAAKAAKAAKSG